MPENVTIYKIAKELGLSPSTVNRALTNRNGVKQSTKELIIQKATQMGYHQNKAASILSRPPIKICAILYNAVNDFTDDLIRGIDSGFNKLESFNVSGSTLVLHRNRPYSEYEKSIDEFVLKNNPNALIILPYANGERMKTVIDKYINMGIPTALIVSDEPTSRRIFTVARNGHRCGAFAAEMLSHMIDEQRPIAVITHSKDGNVHAETIAGFVNFARCNNLNYFGAFEHYDDPEIGYLLADTVLKICPDIGGLYFNSANSVSFCRRLAELGRINDISIVTSDISNEIAQLIRNNSVQYSIFSNPYLQAKKCVEKLYEYITEGIEIENDHILIEPQIIMKSNLEVYTEIYSFNIHNG